MAKDPRTHWETQYRTRDVTEVGWYRPHLEVSMRMIEASAVGLTAPILDVGGGASTLIDDLLEAGYTNLTILDLSPAALQIAGERLGERAGAVRWIAGDVTTVSFEPAAYDLWHDRAVFHFLTEPQQRRAYVDAVRGALRPRGALVISTFSEEAPPRCSGLDIVRYGVESLSAELGPHFELVEHAFSDHTTPGGTPQRFFHARYVHAVAEAGS